MEIKNEEDINTKISSHEYLVENLRQLAATVRFIKSQTSNEERDFSVKISYLKRITKEKIVIRLLVNNLISIIYFILIEGNANRQRLKAQRSEICGNLIEEVISNFTPLNELVFDSDNLNFAGNYTMKYLCRLSSQQGVNVLRTLELDNYLFQFDDSGVFDTNLEFFPQFAMLHDPFLENLSLVFKCKGDPEACLKYIVCNLITKNLRNVKITIYYDHPDQNFEQKYLITTDKNKKAIGKQLINFKLYLINNNLQKSNYPQNEEIKRIADFILYSITTELIHVVLREIFTTAISDTNLIQVSFLTASKLIYNKRFYCMLNSWKNWFNKKNSFLHGSNYVILKTILSFLPERENKYQINEKFLQLNLPSNEAVNKLNKYIFNLNQDYLSTLYRKVKYEDIFQFILDQPEVGQNVKEHKIKIKKDDLNTISKVLSKIEGNHLLFTADGRIVSIGGQFTGNILNQNEVSRVISTIIEINSCITEIRLMTFSENYFLPSFLSAIGKFHNSEEKYIIVGGLSRPELLPNFAMTPMYIVCLGGMEIKKILSEGGSSSSSRSRSEDTICPGVIFSHECSISDDDSQVILTKGYIISGYSGGLQMATEESSNRMKPELIENKKMMMYDLTKNKWTVVNK